MDDQGKTLTPEMLASAYNQIRVQSLSWNPGDRTATINSAADFGTQLLDKSGRMEIDRTRREGWFGLWMIKGSPEGS